MSLAGADIRENFVADWISGYMYYWTYTAYDETEYMRTCISSDSNQTGYDLLKRAFDSYFVGGGSDGDIQAGNAVMLTFLDFIVDAVNNDSEDCPREVKNSINNMSTTIKDFLAQPDWRDQAQTNYDKFSYKADYNWTIVQTNWNAGYIPECGMAYANQVLILMNYTWTPPYILV